MTGFYAESDKKSVLLVIETVWWWHSSVGTSQWFSSLLPYKLIFFTQSIGKGCVFTYDAVGSYERVGYSSQGSGSTLIMPFLDNQLKSPSPLLLPAQVKLSCLFFSWSVCLIQISFWHVLYNILWHLVGCCHSFIWSWSRGIGQNCFCICNWERYLHCKFVYHTCFS